jgi:SIT4-associating protein SAP185/190
LHNVVYDVVQQVFNGAMDRGYNRNVAMDLFETGRITDRVIEGQERSDQSQKEQKMRLGYMGHLTLIAEEIVKFTERQAPETLAPPILDRIMAQSWIDYVENVLSETRERDNAILGGVRPDPTGGPRQAVLNAVNASQNSFANAGSQALSNAGIGTDHLPLDSMDLAAAGAAPGYNLNQSAMFNSDEEDEDDGEDHQLIEHVAEPIGELTAEPDEEEQVGNTPSVEPFAAGEKDDVDERD